MDVPVESTMGADHRSAPASQVSQNSVAGSDSMIIFDHVGKQFFKHGEPMQALEDAHFTVARGEFVSIVGPSGCGKSTLLNIITGLMKPTSGQARYRGRPVASVNTAVGYVTQHDTLLPWRTVRANIAVPLEIRGTGGQRRRDLVDSVIDQVGLSGFGDHYPAELSGGMRKRVILARALVYGPESLAMDEPFGALDAQLKLVLQMELLNLWYESERTILFVTHDLAEAVTLSDRVVVMSSRPGRVRAIEEIDIPRPRDVMKVRFDKRYNELSHHLWEMIQDDMLEGEDM
ncbi:ABC transporter ATP-binding protein [Actinophytocola sp.]|uniref:ABC transporter ATP-binding protein n=1 Tax=Actinophytocola sp. TaxID=1872138 RepID=UPI003D6A4AAB